MIWMCFSRMLLNEQSQKIALHINDNMGQINTQTFIVLNKADMWSFVYQMNTIIEFCRAHILNVELLKVK